MLELVHRVTAAAENAIETKQYCCAAFLDVSQDGLIHKINQYHPYHFIEVLELYFYDYYFQESPAIGVSNGSVQARYYRCCICIVDVPAGSSTTITTILATHDNYSIASAKL